MASGLSERLISRELLVPHFERPAEPWNHPDTSCVLQPQPIPFISYPFEWCFSQLQAAALATLAIQEEALRFGMTLKDAAPENMQFLNGKMVLIDTLSFEPATGPVWAAYFQFCRRFLAPLALVAYGDPRMLKLMASEPDGIPLDTASKLLPRHTWLRPSMALHVHLHARADRRRDSRSPPSSALPTRQRAVVDSLRRAIKNLRWDVPETEWTRYETEKPTYSPQAWEARERAILDCLHRIRPAVVWDLGAALGHASRMATRQGAVAVALDADPSCVELMWRRARRDDDRHLLPIVQDLLRPTPRSGWAEAELQSLSDRGPADLVLVLGFIHHLTIRGGVPIDLVFEYLATLGRSALVEFIPPSDPIVAEWCQKFGRPPLTEGAFRSAAEQHYSVIERMAVADSTRVLYLLRSRLI